MIGREGGGDGGRFLVGRETKGLIGEEEIKSGEESSAESELIDQRRSD